MNFLQNAHGVITSNSKLINNGYPWLIAFTADLTMCLSSYKSLFCSLWSQRDYLYIN